MELGLRIVRARVAMWPAVDGDCPNVACRVKSSGRKHTSELAADFSFEDLERGRQQFVLARPSLLVGMRTKWTFSMTSVTYANRMGDMIERLITFNKPWRSHERLETVAARGQL